VLTRWLVCGSMAAARLAELGWSRHNVHQASEPARGAWSRRTYPAMVAVHTAALALTALRGGDRPRLPWLLLLLAVQPVRLWVLAKLGRRWNTTGAVSPDLAVETGGPYHWVRHPNYAVVEVELLSLPLAFGLRGTGMALAAVNAALLAVRIHDEEALLAARPGWREHFAEKPRFLPGLF
jgi:methyltransferase